MEVGRHDAARATLGRPDDPGGRAISLRRVGLGETWTGVDLVWGRRGSHYEQSWCPLPPLAPPKREREFVVGRCTGGLARGIPQPALGRASWLPSYERSERSADCLIA